jgi:hypothetical protein
MLSSEVTPEMVHTAHGIVVNDEYEICFYLNDGTMLFKDRSFTMSKEDSEDRPKVQAYCEEHFPEIFLF